MLGRALDQFAVVRGSENQAYRYLLLARLISALGTWTAFFAVRIALYDQTKSIAWVSILLFCELAPGVILGLTVGPIVDRWPRQRLMIASDLGGVATFAILPFVHSPAGICALSAVAGISAAFFRPCCYSAVPNLVKEKDLVAANSLMQGADNVSTLAGPVIAALGIALIGADALYGVKALSFLVSALLLVRIGNRLQSDRVGALATRHWKQVRNGLALVRFDPHLSAIFLIWSWATLAYSGINVSEISLARDAYGTGNVGFGILVALAAAGLVAGNLGAAWFIDRVGVYGGYRMSFLVTALGICICAASPGLAIGCVGSVIYGIGNGAGLVCNVTLIQRIVPDASRG
ncbi:MAG: MFS transporter, partial [Actinobacteria bacterium]|nr:MFS transporter [Actinomycetota bacterium]